MMFDASFVELPILITQEGRSKQRPYNNWNHPASAFSSIQNSRLGRCYFKLDQISSAMRQMASGAANF